MDINPEPIDPLIDASSGSVFTGERTGMNRLTPNWGGEFSLGDVIVLAIILAWLLLVAEMIIL